MSIELMRNVSLISYIAAAIMLVIAILLFFLLDIPRIVGDITGSTARKAIEEIRQQNEESGGKVYRSSAINLNRGMVTDKISASGRLIRKTDDAYGLGTSKLNTSDLIEEAIVSSSTYDHHEEETPETTLLSEDGFNEPNNISVAAETTLLTDYHDSETTLLSENVVQDIVSDEFYVEVDMSYSSSSEVIE